MGGHECVLGRGGEGGWGREGSQSGNMTEATLNSVPEFLTASKTRKLHAPSSSDYGDGDYFENGLAAKHAESCLSDAFPCHVSPMHQVRTAG